MLFTVTTRRLEPGDDAQARAVLDDFRGFGLSNVERIEVDRVYRLEGDLGPDDARMLAESLFTDPVVTRSYVSDGPSAPDDSGANHFLEVALNPGVMDPVESSVLKSARDLGVEGLRSVRTATRYRVFGNVAREDVSRAAYGLLVNPTIQHLVVGTDVAPAATDRDDFRGPAIVELSGLDDAGLHAISRRGGLSLNSEEMRKVQAHFASLGRNPTDVELETIAQTWSEHCGHKTFKGRFRYSGPDGEEEIDNLLKQTIVKATRELDRDWCVSVFDDNAGIIRFDERENVCFKVETHNHPSALEPYGGAGTGIGGVIRDILGTGLGGRPVANTDVFCFARPDFPAADVPPGILHPRRVMRGVVAGVRDYGNRMGIPTVNGAVIFDDRYLGNPLVYCGTVGMIPVGCETKTVGPGMAIVLVGGRTGRDGIHGATFSSADLGRDEENVWSNAVQIGNPITEKKVTDVLMKARDRRLYRAITDCGAGGLSSAVGEMGEDTGAEVDLDRVPLKYAGLSYTEIWISEAQERMVLAVPPEHVDELLALFASEDVEATVIGSFTDTKRLVLRYGGVQVADIGMEFLHKGVPQVVRDAVWSPASAPEPSFSEPVRLDDALLAILANPTVASKEWVIRQYDHEVQGGSVLKPLVGAANDGPSDASAVRPFLDGSRGIVLSNGINPRYGLIDPYWMAVACIDEALRQVVAVGGQRDKTALLDNFCWGNPEVPERLGELVRAARGCYDGSKAYGAPFISGKDSFYNEFATPAGTISVPPTLLISAISVLEDITDLISMDLKAPEHFLYLVGVTKPELGGSYYWDLHGALGASVPKVDLENAPAVMDAVARATRMGLVRSCHDCSEGGLVVALAEMAFAGDVGAEIDAGHIATEGMDEDLKLYGRSDVILFSESTTRWVCEVAVRDSERFETAMRNVPYARIGQTTSSRSLRVRGLTGSFVIDTPLDALKEAWQKTLRTV